MATLNISLPDSLKDFASQKVKTSDYSTPSDYVRSLIREDKERAEAREQLDELLRVGLSSGEGLPANSKYWASKRKKLISLANEP